MTASHPARTIPFRDLLDALRSAREARLVSEQAGADGLRIYCYTPSCVFGAQWNDAALIARGLVLDVERETVAATRRTASSCATPRTHWCCWPPMTSPA